MNSFKITVITCTYNSEKYLAKCIKSVQRQNYQNIEHIFIDGMSTDGTIDIIKNYYANPIIYREKDKGIYDALNKGILKASGDVIGILHSDDVFFDDNCLDRVADAFRNKEIDFFCSKMLVYDLDFNKPFAELGASPHKPTFKESLYSSTYYAHPTYYCKKEVFNKVGVYNLQYAIASDIDWLMRLEKLNLPYYFDDKPVYKLRASGKSAKYYFKALWEEFNISTRRNGLSLFIIIIYLFHFSRRGIRFVFEKLKLIALISFCRKMIFEKLKA